MVITATYLNDLLAWSTLREDFGMSGAEIADAIEWALTTLKDVQRRNAAAARLSSGQGVHSPRKRVAGARAPA